MDTLKKPLLVVLVLMIVIILFEFVVPMLFIMPEHGPPPESRRNKKRVSDLYSVRQALEVYYEEFGRYPEAANWKDLASQMVSSSLGITQFVYDPDSSKTYYYGVDISGQKAVLGATLEMDDNIYLKEDVDEAVLGINCDDPVYCLIF